MRIIYFFLSASVSMALVILLDTKWLLPAPFGRLLSPQQGVWQNAEPVSGQRDLELNMEGLAAEAHIYFDERLVPHVFAEDEEDAWFVQGFLHAKYRLWQMELQALSAAGRASEVVGEVALDHDREFRRLGMVYAAENALKEMEKNEDTRIQCNAYTAGVNAYIASLTESSLPLEYKLLGYKPERWTNLKSALFLKYMSYDLAGFEEDFEMTNARNFFSSSDFSLLFPDRPDSSDPIIPASDIHFYDSIGGGLAKRINPPLSADSLYFKTEPVPVNVAPKPDPSNGSNNWALSPSKSATGFPILCNDPHLLLNLPSLWYEMQICAPDFNAYGATFPGAPGIIIGFNDSCAFGFTNAGRDVRDYYEIEFRDAERKEYKFSGQWQKTQFRIEEIKIAGKPSFFDTVAYTIMGPVMYDRAFGAKRTGGQKNYAVRWKAHDDGNELLLFNKLFKSNNYADFSSAVKELHTPGQNCIFASKKSDIALVAQGEFPAKWKGQGDFIMPGTDSSYFWQGNIPQEENPFQLNPARGFVSSANQWPTDTSYPHYLGRNFPIARGFYLNQTLSNITKAGVKEMKALQNNNYNILAEWTVPLLLKYLNQANISPDQMKYFNALKSWNYTYDAQSEGATVYEILWKILKGEIFDDEYQGAPAPIIRPSDITLLEALKRDSSFRFTDNRNTTEIETLPDVMMQSFRKACAELKVTDKEGRLPWGRYKDTRIQHLLKIPAFGREHIICGGNKDCINATKEQHGPDWKMVVHLAPETEAYAVYPGGQSGNPGSKHYDDFIDTWAKGDYYKIWVMKPGDVKNKNIRFSMKMMPLEL